jgi:hypothetical protein
MILSHDLNFEDMTAVVPLGLDKQPRYVLLDASQVSIALPEDFLSGARQSYFTHPNMLHMALYVKSDWLKTIGLMVAKVTKQKHKLSVHSSYEAAMQHLMTLAEANGKR